MMLSTSPFAGLAEFVSPLVMQGYIVLMVLAVVVGTLFDVWHKGSARYFFDNWRASKNKARKPIGGGEMLSIAAQTALVDVLASGEFCNARRRVAHLLGMYGFVIYAATTAILVFYYPTPATPAPPILPMLWWIGALLVCLGGYWFWFFIRADVVAEGHSPFRFVQADLFVVSLVLSTTFALIWAWLQAAGNPWTPLFLALYLIATTVLFGSIPWSKFSHMFFKPAAAFEKRMSEANGTRSNLPPPADAPEKLGSAVKHAHHY
jgi:hypothetical protein